MPVYEFNVFTAEEKTKLTGVEENAAADQTGAEIVTVLEGLAAAEKLHADAIQDGTTNAIPTVAQKAKINDAIISSPGEGEEKVEKIEIVTAGSKLKVTTPEV